jgi:hypothetical protein
MDDDGVALLEERGHHCVDDCGTSGFAIDDGNNRNNALRKL